MEPENYQLVIWFDQEQAKIDELYRFVNIELTANVEKKVGYSADGYLTLSLSGTLEDVDKGHTQIISFIEKTGWNLFRLIDNAGDEIRVQAYSELSKIEQELRAFINRALIETLKFNWWLSLGSIKIPGLTALEYRKSHHPLELMTIEELIDLVTFEKSELRDDDPILLKDLIDISATSSNFDEFRKKLSQKVRKVSLWDLVFSKYFGENASLWGDIEKKDLEFIKNLRNKVMHHRPVHFRELKVLGEKRAKIITFFTSAKTHLSEDQKSEIATMQTEVRDIFAQLVYERTPKNTYTQLYKSLKDSRNTVAIRNLMNEIDTLTTTGGLNKKESLELRAVAFKQLEVFTDYRLDETREIILYEILPLCLSENDEFSAQYRAFRNILVEWIDNHPEQESGMIKNLVLDNLSNSIGTTRHKATSWTISKLGFAREDIIQKLLHFAVNADDEIGDDTFSTLSWLSITQEQKRIILSELHRRAEVRYNNSLVWAFARFGNSASFSVILNQWLQKEKINEKGVDTALAFTAIRDIAEANENDLAFQDVIWKESVRSVEENPEDLYFPFNVGHLSTTCNSIFVIPTYLHWHGQHPEWFPNPQWARYLAQNQLEAAIKPLQIEGWSHIEDKKIFEYLEVDACLDTGVDGFFNTKEWMIKEAAWKTVLRAGYSNALTWFEHAIVGETGRSTREKIMEYLAAFKIDPLPETVFHLITDEFNDLADTDGRELGYRMGAVRLARSLASMNAFDALLNFGYTRKGKVLRESAVAIADVAISLLREGKMEVINIVVRLAIESDRERQRMAAVHALDVISTFPEYHPALNPYQDKLISLVYESKREPFERGQLLGIIARLPGDIPEKFEKDLVAWNDESDTRFQGGRIDVLAQHGKLENYPQLMRNMLNIEKNGTDWEWLTGKSQFEWAAFEIGVLYNKNPESYSNVISSLVESQDWRTTTQIFGWLETTHLGEGKPELPKNVRNALLYRLIHKMSPLYSEVDTFGVLANLAPDNLVNNDLAKAVFNWMPDSKVALANSLRSAQISQDLHRQCIVMLESLVDDGMYSVRRAAYRAITKYSMEHLFNLCKSWIESPILKLNMRAAEACGWIENIASDSEQEFEDLKSACFNHLELNVREAIKRSWKERRHRQWGRIYLEKVLAVQGKNNDEILQAWRFGDVLTRVGDDETYQLLVEHLTQKQLPPNVHFWIGEQILEPLKNNWRKVTQKWPEPWTESSGALERGTGKLIIDADEITDIQYSIWLDSATTPRELHSWGGTMLFSLGFRAFNLNKDTLSMIELEDGRKGKIYFEGSVGNTTTFWGTGAYPS